MSGVVILNGTSSAGKTTLAKAIQDAAERPILRAGIDDLFAMCPEEWAGGKPGRFAQAGFAYRHVSEGDTRITAGPEGHAMLHAFHESVAAMAQSGVDVVMDYLALSVEAANDLDAVLASVPHQWIKVVAPGEVLRARESARGQVPGLALGLATTVHDGVTYDRVIDTSVSELQPLAASVLAGWPKSPRSAS